MSSDELIDIKAEENNKHLEMLELEKGIACGKGGIYPDTCSLAEKCIGCNKVVPLEKCDGTICYKCWQQETVDE